MKSGIITPILTSKRGYISLDCGQMEPFNGYNTIYHMLDTFSKRTYATAMKAQTAQNNIRFFEETKEKFPNFYISAIQADNGSEFKEPFESWCKQQGHTLACSKPHSPWSNPVERYNATLKRMLSQTMRVSNTKDWPSLLPTVVANMKATVSFATGQTPLSVDQSNDKQLHKEVIQKMENKAAKRYGSKAQRGNDIQVGDWVRKVFDYESLKILKASNRGYFAPEVDEVTSVLPSRYPNALPNYKFDTKDTKQVLTGTYAQWQLLKVPKDTTVVEEPEEDRPGEVEGTGVQYEVQPLVDKRTLRGGVVKYRVRWRAWKEKHDTWETEDQLTEDVPEMVAAFDREHE
ncbi:hypothetical protein HDV00_012750 [Rhizophlyctis rosea]|nr:hypothetical protein HDV00_012750 [Rhizophlyctis rosea]